MSREYEPIECSRRSVGIIYFGSSSFFCCKFIFTKLVFFARNVCIVYPALTKLRTLCRIAKVKGVSTDNGEASRELLLILLKVRDLSKGNYFTTN